jgi:arabinan endo-1,5-alpha-L-arabinosidase
MCNWDLLTDSIIDRPTWADGEKYGKPDVWAPDVIKIKDKWIYYYSLAAWDMPSAGIGYAVADNVAGPYTDMGLLFNEDDIEMNGLIDPQPIIDDGHVYMLVGSFHGNYLVELTDDGMALKGGIETQAEEKTLISGVYGDWNGGGTEGSYIIKKNDTYYYFGSSGLCCEGAGSTYRVVVARSKSLKGPYVDDQNRMMKNNNGNGKVICWAKPANTDIAGPGHNSILKDDAGDYWMVYHSYCKDDGFGTRHLMMDKILWDEKGWPYIENTSPSYHEVKDGPRFIVE